MIDISAQSFILVNENRGSFENGGGFCFSEKHVMMMDCWKHQI
jgi:hypothetical protein